MIETTGSRVLVNLLQNLGIDTVIGLPGGTISTFALDVGTSDSLRHILVRNEAVAAFAADAYFRVSGRLMPVLLHTSPGVANALPAISAAYLDSSAMLVIAGEVERQILGRGAIHDLARSSDGDVVQILRHVTKRAWQPHSALQLIEHMLRAVKIATVQRPGPVAISVFKDVWTEKIEIPEWPSGNGYSVSDKATADYTEIDRAAALINSSERPLILAGNGVNTSGCRRELAELSHKLQAPVATTTGGKATFPDDNPKSVGVIGWVGASSANWAGCNADLIVSIGARLSDSTTAGWQPGVSIDLKNAKLIQINIDPEGIANVYPAAVALLGDAGRTLQQLIEKVKPVESRPAWDADIAAAKADWHAVVDNCATMDGELLQVGRVIASLRASTSGTPINLVTDIGNHSSWLIQQFPTHEDDIFVASMGAGTMGIAPCGALGAALARPSSPTIAWVGDGGMSMAPYVLPTLAEYGIPVVIVVLDNGGYSSVANAMTRRTGKSAFAWFDGSGGNPGHRVDFARMAEACGMEARRITKSGELDAAFDWALALGKPVLLDVIVDPKSDFPVIGGQRQDQIWGHHLGPIYPWASAAGNPDGGEME